MDFNALIAELRASSDNLPKESADRSLLSSDYCNKACKALDRIADGTLEYDSVITGLWLIAAHFAEQLAYLKPVPALSELCFKLFRQCAKAVLNIQWQNLEEESSLKQNFLVSLANLHAKLVPFDFPRFRLLEALTENPWTNPTLAKVMGGEIEDSDKEEVRCYIEQEDPIILQLRVDMMLKENCEEYALNLCNSCLSHPELQSDLSVRKTQLSLLYKLGQSDKLQEECQKLSIQDAVRIIKQLQQSKSHRQICTVLAQTFMVQNWIRPSDLEANKELLRLWIRHQVLVDREQDQFKESVWAMAKLSQSTEQIIIFIDVLREECGEAFLQLYVDMCIFAINVDKGQMETSIKELNMEAAAARRSDMASICAKLSCLCHHTSIKVARICALTYFALQPSEQSFAKVNTFYGQGSNCCNKCGTNRVQDHGTVNPATLYEVERLLNMLRPDYLNPDHSYANVQILCRRFLQESLQTAQQAQRKHQISQSAGGVQMLGNTQLEGPGKKKSPVPGTNRPTNVFEAFCQQDIHNTQVLLNKMRLGNSPAPKAVTQGQKIGHQIITAGNSRPAILQHGQHSNLALGNEPPKPQFMFDTEKAKNKQPYGVPLEQQHQYYLLKHEKELEQRRKNAQKKREEKSNPQLNQQQPSQLQHHQQPSQQMQQKQQQPQLPQQQSQQQQQLQPQLPHQHQHQQQEQQFQKQDLHNKQVTQIIQSALRQDSNTLQKLTQNASPEVVQAVISIMKGTVLKSSASHQQQQLRPAVQSISQAAQPLPTVSTLLKPSPHMQQQQPQPYREQPPPRRHPRPQLYAQPIIVSTSSGLAPQTSRLQQSTAVSLPNRNQPLQTSSVVTTVSAVQKQKTESAMLAKSQEEDIRKFMQMQMSNLPQKKISELRQMSGSTVTLNILDMSKVQVTPSSSVQANRPKTTVELAQQAALANLQRQEQQSKQNTYLQQSQLPNHPQGQVYSSQSDSMPLKANQQQYVYSKSSSTMQQLPVNQLQQQQKLMHLPPQQQSSTFSFQSSQNSSTHQTVPPSSDELSGSIMGIDDKIIKELLQDSGILANTFPDIEVDNIAEDKVKKLPEFPASSQHGTLPAHQITPQKQSHSYTASTTPYSQPYNKSDSSSSQPVQGHPYSTVGQHNISASNIQGSLVQPPGSGINQYSASKGSTVPYIATNSMPVSNSSSISVTLPRLDHPSLNSQQVQPTQKQTVSVLPRENISVLPKPDIKKETKPTMDQLREMMKKEDIQGEVCMDSSNNATYRCIICSLAFDTLDNLREHVRTVCKPGLQSSSVYTTKIKQDRAISAKAGLETTTVFQCLRCFELCVSDAGIKQHRLTCKRVPTVPSDLKKDSPQPKSKSVSKLSHTTKPQPKKEQEDNSYNVPEIPLPFPYPSLNAGAVLKSLSEAGAALPKSVTSNVNTISQPQAQLKTYEVKEKLPPLPPPPSFFHLNTVSHTSSNFIANSSPHLLNTSCIASTVTNNNAPQIQPGFSKDGISSSIKESHINVVTPEPLKGVTVVDKSMLEKELASKKALEQTQVKEKPKELPPPSFTEISGSGGSKFYKCTSCSQTLCSLESFHCHWKECVGKNKRASKESSLHASPLTGAVLEAVLSIIDFVAAGGGTIPDMTGEEMSDETVKMCVLTDPCLLLAELSDSKHESENMEEFYESGESKKNQTEVEDTDSNYTSATDDKELSEGEHESKLSQGTFKESNEEEEDDDEEEEETDTSISESERNSLLVSTREAPPKLRDRKTLKPIQSFINEKFISPYSKTVRKGYTKDDKLQTEEVEVMDDKMISGSEAESDGDNLYCKVCKSTYQNKRMLLQHFAGKHLQPYTVKTVADSSSYFCHLCQKTFSTFMHYMQHVPNHSVTIYEKMKAFMADIRLAQRSERIASQRGFMKKSNISPKVAKALKSKKAAVDRLKQQLLAGKTQSVRERLRLSKRKRSLTHKFTSSEDDYSSDASNNVVFKSKKSLDSGNKSDGQKHPVSRTSRSLPRKQESQSNSPGDDSSLLSSGDEGDARPRLRQVRDDDYIASEELDSDSTSKIPPPTTRSKKRSGNPRETFSSYKKTCSQSPERREGNEEERDATLHATSQKGSYSKVTMSDSDTDSDSTTMVFSQSDGSFFPVKARLDEAEDCINTSLAEKNETEQVSCRIIVRSLSKKQKEKLQSCNLQPSVVLHRLSAEDIQTSQKDPQQLEPHTNLFGSASQSQHDSHSMKNSELASSTDRSSGSFLDSYLSYLNQYSSFSDKDTGTSTQGDLSDPCKLQKRRNSFDAKSLSSHHSWSPSVLSRSTSTDIEGSTDSGCTADTETGRRESLARKQDTVQSILSKFQTRRCSVYLGEKINPEAIKGSQSLLVENRDKSKAASCEIMKGKMLSVKLGDKSPADMKQVPIVCLERSELADMYAIKAPTASVQPRLEKMATSGEPLGKDEEVKQDDLLSQQAASSRLDPETCMKDQGIAEGMVTYETVAESFEPKSSTTGATIFLTDEASSDAGSLSSLKPDAEVPVTNVAKNDIQVFLTDGTQEANSGAGSFSDFKSGAEAPDTSFSVISHCEKEAVVHNDAGKAMSAVSESESPLLDANAHSSDVPGIKTEHLDIPRQDMSRQLNAESSSVIDTAPVQNLATKTEKKLNLGKSEEIRIKLESKDITVIKFKDEGTLSPIAEVAESRQGESRQGDIFSGVCGSPVAVSAKGEMNIIQPSESQAGQRLQEEADTMKSSELVGAVDSEKSPMKSITESAFSFNLYSFEKVDFEMSLVHTENQSDFPVASECITKLQEGEILREEISYQQQTEADAELTQAPKNISESMDLNPEQSVNTQISEPIEVGNSSLAGIMDEHTQHSEKKEDSVEIDGVNINNHESDICSAPILGVGVELSEQNDMKSLETKDSGNENTLPGEEKVQQMTTSLPQSDPSKISYAEDSSISQSKGAVPEVINSGLGLNQSRRSRRSKKKENPTKSFQNPNISLAAFIAERLRKEKPPSNSQIGKPFVYSEFRPNTYSHSEPTWPGPSKLESSQLGYHISQNAPKPHTISPVVEKDCCSDQVIQEHSCCEIVLPHSKSTELSPRSVSVSSGLGLVDYSSSDEENDSTGCRLQGKASSMSGCGENSSCKSNPQKVIVLSSAHYSHSVFIPSGTGATDVSKSGITHLKCSTEQTAMNKDSENSSFRSHDADPIPSISHSVSGIAWEQDHFKSNDSERMVYAEGSVENKQDEKENLMANAAAAAQFDGSNEVVLEVTVDAADYDSWMGESVGAEDHLADNMTTCITTGVLAEKLEGCSFQRVNQTVQQEHRGTGENEDCKERAKDLHKQHLPDLEPSTSDYTFEDEVNLLSPVNQQSSSEEEFDKVRDKNATAQSASPSHLHMDKFIDNEEKPVYLNDEAVHATGSTPVHSACSRSIESCCSTSSSLLENSSSACVKNIQTALCTIYSAHGMSATFHKAVNRSATSEVVTCAGDEQCSVHLDNTPSLANKEGAHITPVDMEAPNINLETSHINAVTETFYTHSDVGWKESMQSDSALSCAPKIHKESETNQTQNIQETSDCQREQVFTEIDDIKHPHSELINSQVTIGIHENMGLNTENNCVQDYLGRDVEANLENYPNSKESKTFDFSNSNISKPENSSTDTTDTAYSNPSENQGNVEVDIVITPTREDGTDAAASETAGQESGNESQGIDNELDDGDDLSDFDLVIEKDTSPRSIVPLPPSFAMKRSSPMLDASENRSSPTPSGTSSTYSNKVEQQSGSAYGNKDLKILGAKSYKNIHMLAQKPGTKSIEPSSTPRKPLGGAKALRKSSQEQFVWDIDEDNDIDQVMAITAPVPINSAMIASSVLDRKSSPALEAFRRKQRALRERTDTSPFTWDLEDAPDKESSSMQGKDFLSVLSPTPHNSCDTLQKSNFGISRNKVAKKSNQGKRSLTPDVVSNRKPSKVRRTSSFDKQSKIQSALIDKGSKNESNLEMDTENPLVSETLMCNAEASASNNSIHVDEDISFKKDSFSPPMGCLEFVTSSGQSSPSGSTSGEDRMHRRNRSKRYPLQAAQTKTSLTKEEKVADPQQTREIPSLKSQLGLRSRHNSMESNKSDPSTPLKRQADSCPHVTTKRPRKNEDPLTPKLKKAGLIKITKDSSSPASSTGSDSSAPLTRSSEAAIKAFNQKSLRNRGVSPVSLRQSSSSSPSKNSSITHQPKSSIEASPKLRSSPLIQKSSPSSFSSSKSSPGLEVKSDSKTSNRKSDDNTMTAAVVKRRGPSVSLLSSPVNRNRTPLAPRPRKSISAPKVNSPNMTLTTVFRVEPVPSAVAPRGVTKPLSTSSNKEVRTVHTRLPPGTTLKAKKEITKQPKWKINKTAKQTKSRKAQKSSVSGK